MPNRDHRVGPNHDAEVMRTENDINGEEANNLYVGPSDPPSPPPPPDFGWSIRKTFFFKYLGLQLAP